MIVANIFYGKIRMALPQGPHLGSNLRAFFGVPDDEHLYLESDDPRDPEDECIMDSAEVQVMAGQKFYSLPKKINE